MKCTRFTFKVMDGFTVTVKAIDINKAKDKAEKIIGEALRPSVKLINSDNYVD